MSFKKNIVANYIGTTFLVLTPVLALPFYLHALGSSVWGLVSFIATLQSLLGLLDAGLTQALVREFAVAKNQDFDSKNRLGTILFGFERIYWIFSLCIGVLVLLASNYIVQSWLKLDQLDVEQARLAVYGAAAIFVFQFPGSVYRSFLLGTQAQVLLNSIMTLGILIRHIGCVIIVIKWPTLFTYLIWQITSIVLETIVRGLAAWRVTQLKRSDFDWDKLLMQRILLPIVGMSGATMLGVLTVQMDKIILSGMIPVEKFGFYSIASTISIGVLQLIYPIMNAATPYAISIKNDGKSLRFFNSKYASIVVLMTITAGVSYYFFGYIFLSVWLKDTQTVNQVYKILNILLIGSALNSLYMIGYLNWMIHGQFLKIFKVNLMSFIVSVITTPAMILKFGIIGASFGWILMNMVGLFFSVVWFVNVNMKKCETNEIFK